MPSTRAQARAHAFKPPAKFKHLWEQSNVQNGGRNHFFLDDGRVIGKVAFFPTNLQSELAWLTCLRSRVDAQRAVLPEPIGSVVEDDGRYCLYLRVIPGQTLAQWIEEHGPLSNSMARKVADAYMALREGGAPDSGNDDLIPGGFRWQVMGHVFNEDNEAECELESRTAFKAMTDECFQAGVGLKARLPIAAPSFAHGDVSPTNILLTQDDRIVIIDFGYSAWLPEYWDAYVLSTNIYMRPEGFLEPMRAAFKEKGIWIDQDDPRRILMEAFASWSMSQKGRWYLK
jgi:hypothetical protein